MRFVKAAQIVVVALMAALPAQASLNDAAERIAVGTCATCHGPHGQSTSPKFPVLSGQHANYLIAQLQTFKAQTRGDPDAIGYMWGMAAPLSDEIIVALADYYSKQPTRAGRASNAALLARGKTLYENGNATEGIPACASCHGIDATGTENFPRLAGQHASYLVKQLRSFRTNLRDVAVMHGVAEGMQATEMEAVAAYLQSL